MKNLKKTILTIILIIGIIGGAAFALTQWEPYTLWSIKHNPAAQLKRSFEKTTAVLQSGMLFDAPNIMEQALAQGAIGIDLTTLDQSTMSNMLYLRDNGIAMNGSVGEAETTPWEYGFWLTEEAMVVKTPGAEGTNAYGLHFATLKDDLKDSALLTYMGVSYEEACEYIDSAFGDQDNTEEDAQKNEMQKMLQLAQLIKNCPVIVDEGTLAVENKNVEVYHISYTISPTQMHDAVDLLISWNAPSAGEKSEAEAKAAADELAQLKDAIIESNTTAVLDFYLHNKTQVIVQAALRMDWMQGDDAGTIAANITLGENPATSLSYTASVAITQPGQTREDITVEYQRSNAHNLPGRKLILSNKGESVTMMELQYNAVSKTFDLNLMDRTYTMHGICKEEADKLIVQADLKEIGELTLTFHAKEELPKVPGFTNICTLSEAELEVLFAEPSPDYPDDGDWDDDPWNDNSVNITVFGSNDSMYFLYYSGDYDTLADLMVAEEIAVLNENGKIVSLCLFDEQVPGEVWTVYIEDVLYEGSLHELLLTGSCNITISGTAAGEIL